MIYFQKMFDDLIQNTELTPANKSVLIYLMSMADNGKGRATRVCWSSKPEIAIMSGVKMSSVKRSLKVLTELGYIKKQIRIKANGYHDTNLYTVIYKPPIVKDALLEPRHHPSDEERYEQALSFATTILKGGTGLEWKDIHRVVGDALNQLRFDTFVSSQLQFKRKNEGVQIDPRIDYSKNLTVLSEPANDALAGFFSHESETHSVALKA